MGTSSAILVGNDEMDKRFQPAVFGETELW